MPHNATMPNAFAAEHRPAPRTDLRVGHDRARVRCANSADLEKFFCMLDMLDIFKLSLIAAASEKQDHDLAAFPAHAATARQSTRMFAACAALARLVIPFRCRPAT